MNVSIKRRMFIVIIALSLAACGGTTAPNLSMLPANGSTAAGKMIFEQGTANATACGACHIVDDSPVESGPRLKGIGQNAATRVSGQSAELYLYTSIVMPNAYLVPGYAANIMPQTYAQTLTPQQIRDVITYLLTLT